MSIEKRQHIVAETILKNFTDADGSLFFFDKTHPDKGVRRRKPKKVLTKYHLNTIFNEDCSRDTSVEKFLGDIENKAAPVIKAICQALRSEKTPILSPEDVKSLRQLVLFQFARAPDFHQRLGLTQNVAKFTKGIIKEYEKEVRPLTKEEFAEITTSKSMEEIARGAEIKARSITPEKSMAMLERRAIFLASISDRRKSFVTGDHPLVWSMRSGARETENELWMAVAADVAVGWVSPYGPVQTVFFNTDDVRRFNERVYKNSNVVAGRSVKLLQSLVGHIAC